MDTDTVDVHELKKVRQLLAKNIDDFKYLVLCNMRLGDTVTATDPMPINRIEGFKAPANLEEWVKGELDLHAKKESVQMEQFPGETLEQWVKRMDEKKEKQHGKVKAQSIPSLLDRVEGWLMNEAKKDLFAKIDPLSPNVEHLSSANIRALGNTLIALADKLEHVNKRNKA